MKLINKDFYKGIDDSFWEESYMETHEENEVKSLINTLDCLINTLD